MEDFKNKYLKYKYKYLVLAGGLDKSSKNPEVRVFNLEYFNSINVDSIPKWCTHQAFKTLQHYNYIEKINDDDDKDNRYKILKNIVGVGDLPTLFQVSIANNPLYTSIVDRGNKSTGLTQDRLDKYVHCLNAFGMTVVDDNNAPIIVLNSPLQQIRIENERIEKERIEKERIEKERIEKERKEKERIEKERIKKERIDDERIEKERIEKERIEKERKEKERKEKERIEKERKEKERKQQIIINARKIDDILRNIEEQYEKMRDEREQEQSRIEEEKAAKESINRELLKETLNKHKEDISALYEEKKKNLLKEKEKENEMKKKKITQRNTLAKRQQQRQEQKQEQKQEQEQEQEQQQTTLSEAEKKIKNYFDNYKLLSKKEQSYLNGLIKKENKNLRFGESISIDMKNWLLEQILNKNKF